MAAITQDIEKTPVMVNGLPGKMATEVAKHIAQSEDFELFPFALTGRRGMQTVEIGGHSVQLCASSQSAELHLNDGGMAVDFTQPDAVLPNAAYYCEHEINFIMGTTGGDRVSVEAKVMGSRVNAVMAPNMAIPIVALQAKIEELADSLKGLMNKGTLYVVESHQQGKKDTSGTAKAMVQYFNKMGIEFDVSEIVMIRDPEKQRKIGVPEEYLGGHGWHTYTLGVPSWKPSCNDDVLNEVRRGVFQFLRKSPVFRDFEKGFNPRLGANGSIIRTSHDGTVRISAEKPAEGILRIAHNVNGRSVYADGTLEALRFERERIRMGAHGKVWTMMDVIRSL